MGVVVLPNLDFGWVVAAAEWKCPSQQKKSNTRGVAHFARTYRTLSLQRPHADCRGNDSSGIKRGVHVVLSSVEQRPRVAMEHRGWTR
jgi:hypothetical protein